MKYKEIRKYHVSSIINSPIEDYYAYLLSPFLTKVFLRFKIIPNSITLMMILSGLTGAVLFVFPDIYISLAGLFFIHLWYVLDCSDGEVAKITKNFSLYGQELDYMAHNLNHPFFTMAFIIKAGSLDKIYILLIAIAYILDSMFRFTLSLNFIVELKEPRANRGKVNKENVIVLFIKWMLRNLNSFPLYVLVFPILLMCDNLEGKNIGLNFMLLKTAASLIYTIFCVIRILKYIYPKKRKESE